MDATQKTTDPLQQKIDKFGRLCAACLGWGAKQPRNSCAQDGKCMLAGFLGCHRLALQLYLMSEQVIPGVVLCDAHEGFAEYIAPVLKECGASISRIATEAAWLIRPGILGEQTAPTTSDMSYARGCDGAWQKNSEGARALEFHSAHWVCTSGDLEIVLWKPRSSGTSAPAPTAKNETGVKTPGGFQPSIPVYFEILSAFRAALAPLGLDVHICVG